MTGKTDALFGEKLLPGYSRLISIWALISFSLMFSILIWHPSRAAAMNIMDAVFFLPALFLSPWLLYRNRLFSPEILIAALPLLLYIGYGLISITWSETPNASRSIRAALQITALFLFLAWLMRTGARSFLEHLLYVAGCVTAVACAWHLVMFYGFTDAGLGTTLYTHRYEDALRAMGVNHMNAIAATLTVAPQTALMAALVYRRRHRAYAWVGMVALSIMLVYLIALERRTGQVALVTTVGAALIVYRNPFWLKVALAGAVAGVVAYLFVPELLTSRGVSWRPQIWLSSLQQGMAAPWFGHGLSNTMTPVPVYDHAEGVMREFVHPHNMALSVFYYLGITGVLLWLLLWLPGLTYRLLLDPQRVANTHISFPLAAGVAALVFDGGYAMAAFDFDWFCFWFPVAMLLTSFIPPSQSINPATR